MAAGLDGRRTTRRPHRRRRRLQRPVRPAEPGRPLGRPTTTPASPPSTPPTRPRCCCPANPTRSGRPGWHGSWPGARSSCTPDSPTSTAPSAARSPSARPCARASSGSACPSAPGAAPPGRAWRPSTTTSPRPPRTSSSPAPRPGTRVSWCPVSDRPARPGGPPGCSPPWPAAARPPSSRPTTASAGTAPPSSPRGTPPRQAAPGRCCAASPPRASCRPAARLLVEEYVPGRGRLRNLTFDAVIADDGTVHPVGTAVMHVDGTSYRGATAGPGAVPPRAAATAEAFGLAVGAELARAGHRGWYDVDFVTDPAGRLAPTEANLRLTGPAVAFVLAARLDAVHGPGHRVRTLDMLPLGARLPQQALLAHLSQLAERCERFGVRLLPTIPTASWEELPTAGVALAARAPDTVTALDALDAAEAVVRAACEALADPFDAVAPDVPGVPGVSARPARGRAAR
ncbi:hypothetical protein ACFQ1I_42050 [Kitasatospora arboriphila]